MIDYEVIEMKDVQIFAGGEFVDFEDKDLISYDDMSYKLSSGNISWNKQTGVTVKGLSDGEKYIINYPLGEIVFNTKKKRNLKASGQFYTSNICALAESFSLETSIDEIKFKVIGMSTSKKLKTNKEITASVEGFDVLNEKLWEIMIGEDLQNKERQTHLSFNVLGKRYIFPVIIGDISTGGSVDDYLKNSISFTLLDGIDIVEPPKLFNIKYNLDGGTGNFNDEQIIEGENYTISNEKPIKKNNNFKHWIDEDGNIYDPGQVIKMNKNIELKAVWEEEQPDIEGPTKEEFEEASNIFDFEFRDPQNCKECLVIKGFKDGIEDTTENFNKITNLEYNGLKVAEIGTSAFTNSNFTGDFPELNNLEKIGNFSFRYSEFTGDFPELNNLEIIGNASFSNSNFTGDFPKLNNLKKINSFENSNFTGDFPELNNLKEIGSSAFKNSNFTGSFPKLNNLKEILSNAFKNSNFTGAFPDLNNLEEIWSSAFENSKFSGDFPELNNLREIDKRAFMYSEFTGTFPELNNLEWIRGTSFSNSNFTGDFPKLNNLREIGVDAFRKSDFTGNFPELNNLEEIGESAFYNSNFTGDFPKLNNLKIIGSDAFRYSEFTGDFPELNNLEEIGKDALMYSNFDNIPNDFYPGWDGIQEWVKPEELMEAYVSKINDELEEMNTLSGPIYAPGGKIGGKEPLKYDIKQKARELLDDGYWPILIRYIEEEDGIKGEKKVLMEDIIIEKDKKTINIQKKEIKELKFKESNYDGPILIDGSKVIDLIYV